MSHYVIRQYDVKRFTHNSINGALFWQIPNCCRRCDELLSQYLCLFVHVNSIYVTVLLLYIIILLLFVLFEIRGKL